MKNAVNRVQSPIFKTLRYSFYLVRLLLESNIPEYREKNYSPPAFKLVYDIDSQLMNKILTLEYEKIRL